MVSDEEAEKILNSIYNSLPYVYKRKCEVCASGSHKGIIVSKTSEFPVRLFDRPDSIYLIETQDGLGDAVTKGLGKNGYNVSELVLGKQAFYFFELR